MQGLDAILVRNINGKIVVTDDSVFGYGPATTDPDQNVKFEGSKIKNGILQVKFSRPIEVSDKQADLPLSKCTQWQVCVEFFNQQHLKFVVYHSSKSIAWRSHR